MTEASICDATRTPVGRYSGSLSAVCVDNLGAVPLKELMARNPQVDWSAIDDAILGCVSQTGEDNRNVVRMLSLLAGLPDSVPGSTINRLRSSGMDATGTAARATRSGETALMIVGGVESMSRVPFVMGKVASAFSRDAAIYDTTIDWHFINPLTKTQHGVDSMPETAENAATDYKVNREDQDRFALRSRASAARAQEDGMLVQEIIPVMILQRRGDATVVGRDEHPCATSMGVLAKLKGVMCPGGTAAAGNASGVNDGAYALLLVNEASAKRFGLTPRACIIGMAIAGVPPRMMGIGPALASQRLLKQLGLSIDQMGAIELSRAFVTQDLAVMRQSGLRDDDPRVNPNDGVVAFGHPFGMSGMCLVTTTMYWL